MAPRYQCPQHAPPEPSVTGEEEEKDRARTHRVGADGPLDRFFRRSVAFAPPEEAIAADEEPLMRLKYVLSSS